MTILYAAFGLLFILICIMVINTVYKRPSPIDAVPYRPLPLDEDKFARHLSGMIRLKTVTAASMNDTDSAAFLGLHRYLEKTYPLMHRSLEKQVINSYSLLYKWTGSGSDEKPFLLIAHMDVVPVEKRTAGEWLHEPFSGDIADGYVWGRGAIDMKGQLTAIFESVEYLLEEGYAPQRDIYIAVGHDEECMGSQGAQKIAEYLRGSGVRFDFVLDEGGVVTDGAVMGINAMVATIGICEKGYADIKLTATSSGGHASRPPKTTAVGALAAAITALEKGQLQPGLHKPLKDMLDAVGGYMKFPLNIIAANLFITKRLLLAGFAAKPTGSALVRTTTAPTMLSGSSAPNVLAEKAEAIVNFRIAPQDSVETLLRHIKRTVCSGIAVDVLQAYEPSGVSDTKTQAYQKILQTIKSIFPDYVIAPYLMIAATDSRLYEHLADGVYRFSPFRSLSEDLDTIHGVGERLKTESLREGVEFYIRLVKNAGQ